MLAATVAVDTQGISRERNAAERDVGRVFADYAPFVIRALRNFGVRERDVDDVCQDVFLTVHRKLPGFSGRSSLRTWLYGIAWRTAANHRRRRGRQDPAPLADPPVAPEQEETLARRRARAQLLRLLDSLDESKRAVFVLYELEQLSMREVAEAVGCPLQTAYSRHKAARAIVLAAARELDLERSEP